MSNQKKLLGIGFFGFIILVAVGFTIYTSQSFEAETTEEPIKKEIPEKTIKENYSLITDLPCENYQKRAYAIMYSGDRSARQYFSNLSLADFVLEIPHRYVHGQPRLMGVFQCNIPDIVGPMRSGRVDHISVAASLDAIYVPWGGSSIGKSLLKRGVVDLIDCNGEVYPGGEGACFRREGPMSMLEKASTSVPDLMEISKRMEYRETSNFEGFPHKEDKPIEKRPEFTEIEIGFEAPSNVKYVYDPESNSYKRYFDGSKDIDYETKQQYAPKNLIVIFTQKEPWLVEVDYTAQGHWDPWQGVDKQHRKNDSGQYPNMQLGDAWFDSKTEGEAIFFLDGEKITGSWKKGREASDRFQFFDETGEEIKFVPGQIWMHVLEDYQTYSYNNNQAQVKQQSEPDSLNEPN
ncbi:MAG: DUF3048 domain-containing protein [Candidatus Moranbacteria bacterium]|nr:DUF3048 domain-containing protein [Candidatus Moranbacteria bacterium]